MAIHQYRKFLRDVHHNTQHNYNSNNKMVTLEIEQGNETNSDGSVQSPVTNATYIGHGPQQGFACSHLLLIFSAW